MSHTVERVKFDFAVGSRDRASEIHSRLSAFSSLQLEQILGECLDDCRDAASDLRLDRLVLDLGDLPDQGMEDELARRLRLALREALATRSQWRDDQDVVPRSHSPKAPRAAFFSTSTLQSLRDRLFQSVSDAADPKRGLSLDELVLAAIREVPKAAFHKLMLLSWRQSAVRHRLLWQCDDLTLDAIIAFVGGVGVASLLRNERQWAHAREVVVATESTSFDKLLRGAALDVLLAEQKTPQAYKSEAHGLLHALAARLNVPVEFLHKQLSYTVKALSPSTADRERPARLRLNSDHEVGSETSRLTRGESEHQKAESKSTDDLLQAPANLNRLYLGATLPGSWQESVCALVGFIGLDSAVTRALFIAHNAGSNVLASPQQGLEAVLLQLAEHSPHTVHQLSGQLAQAAEFVRTHSALIKEISLLDESSLPLRTDDEKRSRTQAGGQHLKTRLIEELKDAAGEEKLVTSSPQFKATVDRALSGQGVGALAAAVPVDVALLEQLEILTRASTLDDKAQRADAVGTREPGVPSPSQREPVSVVQWLASEADEGRLAALTPDQEKAWIRAFVNQRMEQLKARLVSVPADVQRAATIFARLPESVASRLLVTFMPGLGGFAQMLIRIADFEGLGPPAREAVWECALDEAAATSDAHGLLTRIAEAWSRRQGDVRPIFERLENAASHRARDDQNYDVLVELLTALPPSSLTQDSVEPSGAPQTGTTEPSPGAARRHFESLDLPNRRTETAEFLQRLKRGDEETLAVMRKALTRPAQSATLIGQLQEVPLEDLLPFAGLQEFEPVVRLIVTYGETMNVGLSPAVWKLALLNSADSQHAQTGRRPESARLEAVLRTIASQLPVNYLDLIGALKNAALADRRQQSSSARSLLADIVRRSDTSIDEAARSDHPAPATTDIYIRNAGLSLLWPFLPTYFERAGLLVGGAFTSDAAQRRAVHLCQYLVDGRSDAPEHELALNKIVCGLGVSLPIDASIDLDRNDIDLASGLLAAVLEQWSVLGGTTQDGLQTTFLQREGWLTDPAREGEWMLRVPTEAYDVLLQQLPWSFSLIKTSWMSAALRVEWT